MIYTEMDNSVFLFHDLMYTLLSRAKVIHKNNTDLRGFSELLL